MWCRSGTYEYDIHHLYWTVLLSQTFCLIFFLFFIWSKAVDMKRFWHLTCRSHEVVHRIAGLEPEASWVSWAWWVSCFVHFVHFALCSSFRLLCFREKRSCTSAKEEQSAKDLLQETQATKRLAQVVLRGKGDQVVAEAPLHPIILWKTRAKVKNKKRRALGFKGEKDSIRIMRYRIMCILNLYKRTMRRHATWML